MERLSREDAKILKERRISKEEAIGYNSLLKEKQPSKYKEGWRAKENQTGWVPPASARANYIPRNAPCTGCGKKEFYLNGVGTPMTAMWACKHCGALHRARKK